MPLTVFRATVRSTKSVEWLDRLMDNIKAENGVNIELHVSMEKKPVNAATFNFLLNSRSDLDKDELLDLAEALRHILDAFAYTSTTVFRVETWVDQKVVNTHYRRGGVKKSYTDVVKWVETCPPLYSTIFLGRRDVGSKSAFNPVENTREGIKQALYSDINKVAIFMAIQSGDGMGTFTVFHKDQ